MIRREVNCTGNPSPPIISYPGLSQSQQREKLVSCDKSGNRVGAWPFGAGHLILIAGINKIISTLADALLRIREYALPLKNARANGKCTDQYSQKESVFSIFFSISFLFRYFTGLSAALEEAHGVPQSHQGGAIHR